LFGPPVLAFIHSKTHLLPLLMMLLYLIVAFLESNHSMSGLLLLTKNEVPFVKAAIISGFASLGMLFFSFEYTTIGIWGMILAPGIAQAVYQNWKWPLKVKRELNITGKDYWSVFTKSLNDFKLKNK